MPGNQQETQPCTCGPNFQFTEDELIEIDEFVYKCKHISYNIVYHCRHSQDQCTIPIKPDKLKNPSFARTKCKKHKWIRDYHASWISAGGQYPYEGSLIHQCGSQRKCNHPQKKCIEAGHMSLGTAKRNENYCILTEKHQKTTDLGRKMTKYIDYLNFLVLS